MKRVDLGTQGRMHSYTVAERPTEVKNKNSPLDLATGRSQMM